MRGSKNLLLDMSNFFIFFIGHPKKIVGGRGGRGEGGCQNSRMMKKKSRTRETLNLGGVYILKSESSSHFRANSYGLVYKNNFYLNI